MEKGIISKQEFDAAVCDVKPQFSDLKNEIAKNKKEHEKRASEIYEILEENNKNQEETMNFFARCSWNKYISYLTGLVNRRTHMA